MDQAVLDAIERWPNVPAVYGWLSLSKRGQWRLHPNGQANQGGFGDTIHNQQILTFIDRNYASDEQGRWYFQNGPQRVFVRLDAAPFIISVTGQPSSLRTHHQQPVQHIERWFIDQQGQLYLLCEHGPAMICDQDLELVINVLQTDTGADLLDWWDTQLDDKCSHTQVFFKPQSILDTLLPNHKGALLEMLPHDKSAGDYLGFVSKPHPI